MPQNSMLRRDRTPSEPGMRIWNPSNALTPSWRLGSPVTEVTEHQWDALKSLVLRCFQWNQALGQFRQELSPIPLRVTPSKKGAGSRPGGRLPALKASPLNYLKQAHPG